MRADVNERAAARKTRATRWDVLGVVALGGALGSLLRWGATLVLPNAAEFPWSTLAVNTAGCFAIGVLMFVIIELVTAHRLVRPFLGVGLLGGLTTFSTYVADAVKLVAAGRAGLALAYLLITALAALTAVVAGLAAARTVARSGE